MGKWKAKGFQVEEENGETNMGMLFDFI